MTQWIDSIPVNIPASLADLDLIPLVKQIPVRRGITERAAGGYDLPGLRAAVHRVNQAIRTRESICVWDDFDVNGQTSTALLVQTLRVLGQMSTGTSLSAQLNRTVSKIYHD